MDLSAIWSKFIGSSLIKMSWVKTTRKQLNALDKQQRGMRLSELFSQALVQTDSLADVHDSLAPLSQLCDHTHLEVQCPALTDFIRWFLEKFILPGASCSNHWKL